MDYRDGAQTSPDFGYQMLRDSLMDKLGTGICKPLGLSCCGHTTMKAPDPISTRKLSMVGPD